jgi:hypothetical protein
MIQQYINIRQSVGGVSYTALTDDTQEPVYYIGWTSDNTTYYVTRITVSDDGTTTTGTSTGSWGDRYILIYT